jgi:hypothetical protein
MSLPSEMSADDMPSFRGFINWVMGEQRIELTPTLTDRAHQVHFVFCPEGTMKTEEACHKGQGL